MPTYQYICEKCGNAFEIMKLMSKYKEPEICHDCGAITVRQIGSGSGIIFKGTGFYETDYKNKER